MIDQTTATSGASFLYPALTDVEQTDTHELVAAYRRTMGRTRILAMVVTGTLVSWAFYHSRREAHAHPHKRRRHRRYVHA